MNESTMLHLILILIPVDAFILFFFMSIKENTPFVASWTILSGLALFQCLLQVFADPKIREVLGWAH